MSSAAVVIGALRVKLEVDKKVGYHYYPGVLTPQPILYWVVFEFEQVCGVLCAILFKLFADSAVIYQSTTQKNLF